MKKQMTRESSEEAARLLKEDPELALPEHQALKKRLLPVMKHECGKNGISMVFFMLTDILEESSEILCYGEGSGRLVEESFEVKEKDGGYMLPGVVSRKKQLIPAFIGTLQQNNN